MHRRHQVVTVSKYVHRVRFATCHRCLGVESCLLLIGLHRAQQTISMRSNFVNARRKRPQDHRVIAAVNLTPRTYCAYDHGTFPYLEPYEYKYWDASPSFAYALTRQSLSPIIYHSDLTRRTCQPPLLLPHPSTRGSCHASQVRRQHFKFMNASS